MPLRKSEGNMYDFVTHVWNPVKGRCAYGCSYCYVKKIANRFGKQQPEPYLDEKEMRASLGSGNFIFVCSATDLFQDGIPVWWITHVMDYVRKFPGNSYLWHTKNPLRARAFNGFIGKNDMLCITIESDLYYPEISKADIPDERFKHMIGYKKPWMLTMEPIMDFSMPALATNILLNMPVQVNIGADSGRNNLPEPGAEKLTELIDWLEPRTKVHLKKNLRRLLPEHRLYGEGV